MKLKNLEIRLQKVAGFKKPKAEFEQYMTPAPLAARFLFDAFLHGDIEGMKVLDLGCGTGMLSVGAALLGGNVTGVDGDSSALLTAEKMPHHKSLTSHSDRRLSAQRLLKQMRMTQLL